MGLCACADKKSTIVFTEHCSVAMQLVSLATNISILSWQIVCFNWFFMHTMLSHHHRAMMKKHISTQRCTWWDKFALGVRNLSLKVWVHLIFNSKLSRPGYYKQPTCHFFLIQHKKFITSNAEKFCMQFSHYNS